MIIPQHIWNYVQVMEKELQRRYEFTRNAEIKKALKDVKSDKELLKFNQNKSESLKDENLKETLFCP